MKQGIIIATTFLAALIAGGEVEQGTFGTVGIICTAWLVFVAIANFVPRKKKAQCRHIEPKSAEPTKIVKHALMVTQATINVKEGKA